VLPGWSIADHQAEIVACVEAAAKQHPFLAKNPPVVEWSGFLSEGYELTGAEDSKPSCVRPMRLSMAGR
jgi:acetylornithine deacetylase